MKKRILLTTVLFALAATGNMMAYKFASDGVYYNITKDPNGSEPGKVSVVSGDGYSGTVTIPASVQYEGKAYSVTAIAAEAFQNSIHLTGVNIGSNVETIGYRAFYGCEELQEIVIPDNVTQIQTKEFSSESQAFFGCSQLKSAILGAGIKTMYKNVFNGCQNLQTVTINDGCQQISDGCFNGCIRLKQIIIPASVKSIGNSAFSGCINLTKASIGNGVESIGEYAFNKCQTFVFKLMDLIDREDSITKDFE